MEKTLAERYAQDLFGQWASDLRVTLGTLSANKDHDARGNILIHDNDRNEMTLELLATILQLVKKSVAATWCNSHNLSPFPMVGYVLDTMGRLQLMMWVDITPRTPVLRERRK